MNLDKMKLQNDTGSDKNVDSRGETFREDL